MTLSFVLSPFSSLIQFSVSLTVLHDARWPVYCKGRLIFSYKIFYFGLVGIFELKETFFFFAWFSLFAPMEERG